MFTIMDKIPELIDELGYEHIIADEFQDSNNIQMEALKRLSKAKSFKSLVVVGDDSQSIFGFRDTTPENILHFFEKMGIKNGVDIRLTDNYRSTPQIIELANKINALNKNRVEKDLISRRENGVKPIVRGFHSKDDELEFIANEIQTKIEAGYNPEDIAFISRINADLPKIGEKLAKRGIPWTMLNPTKLLSNSKVKAAIALADACFDPEATMMYFYYLNALYNGEIAKIPADRIKTEVADLKSLFMGMDSTMTIDAQRALFHQHLEKLKTPFRAIIDETGEVVTEAIPAEELGDDEIYNNFLELLYQCEDFPSELKYVSDFKKYGTDVAKRMEQSYKGVALVTAHSSKGLEWPVVFNSLSAYDSWKNHSDESVAEETRRLLFVSLTRARDELIVTGEYVAFKQDNFRKLTKSGKPTKDEVYNMFLREVFEQLGEKYDPIDYEKIQREAQKKEEAKKKAAERRAKNQSALANFNLPGQLSF